MIKPPPTPNRPDRKPAETPAIAISRAQARVHIRRPAESSWHGAAEESAGFFAGFLMLCRNVWNAAYASTMANSRVRGAFGILCARNTPKGDVAKPARARRLAARYLTFPRFKASSAPMAAETLTANNAIGAASAI